MHESVEIWVGEIVVVISALDYETVKKRKKRRMTKKKKRKVKKRAKK